MYIYKHIFYRIYRLMKSINKGSDFVNAFAAINLISFQLCLFSDFIFRFIVKKLQWDYYPYFTFIIFGLIFLTNLIIFFVKDHFLEIESVFFNETKKSRKWGIVTTLIFIAITTIPVIIYFWS
jgi:hypothetical protein